MSLVINILLGIYVFIAVLMILVILMQRPKSEGLGAAFGGGVTENIFGAQTTNVLTKFTGWLAAIFFLLTFVLSILYARKANTPSNLTRELTAGQTPAPVASATPIPGASVSGSPSGSAAPATSPDNSPVAVTSATLSPAPTTSSSVAPAATAPAASPKPSAAASVSASPKP
jgi:preprotein translocase subunit SecG